jgi:hypothetical protein
MIGGHAVMLRHSYDRSDRHTDMSRIDGEPRRAR